MFVIRRRLPTGCNPSGEGANLTISAIAIVLASRRGCLRELFRALAAQEDDWSPPHTLDCIVGGARRDEPGVRTRSDGADGGKRRAAGRERHTAAGSKARPLYLPAERGGGIRFFSWFRADL